MVIITLPGEYHIWLDFSAGPDVAQRTARNPGKTWLKVFEYPFPKKIIRIGDPSAPQDSIPLAVSRKLEIGFCV